MRGVIKAGPGPGLAFRDDLSVPGKMILYPGPVKNRPDRRISPDGLNFEMNYVN